MKKGFKQNTIRKSIRVLIAVLALFLFNIDAKAEVTFSQNFNYTGGEQTLTVPYAGRYKLETWGASSGNSIGGNIGGYGAYSVGAVEVKADTKLYINVGGQPLNGGYIHNTTGAGGYNGGGNATTLSQYDDAHPGGGATHIATESGLLRTFSNKKDKVLIVSGGGGGAYYYSINGTVYSGSGGNGGGYIGGMAATGTCTGRALYVGTAASQTSAGTSNGCGFNSGVAAAFGQGGSEGSWSSGGGGGWYGGGFGFAHGANGGSSYIGSSELISSSQTTKHMTCLNCATSTANDTRTNTTTCGTSNPTADCAKWGHGYARIILEEPYTLLKNVTVNKGNLTEDFDSLNYSYTWIIPKGIDELTDEDITPVVYGPTPTVVVPESVPFTQDGDTFDIDVIADNIGSQKYTFTMQRYVSNDARLASLTADKGKFKEEFNSDNTDYTLEIFDDVESVTIDAEAFEQDNQGIVGIGEISLDSNEKNIEITSTAEDGTILVYKVHIIKNMYLKNILIENINEDDCEEGQCTFNPEFNKEIEDYTFYIPIEYVNLNVSYVPSSDDFTVGIRINEVSYLPGYKLQRIKNVVKFNIYNDDDEIVKTYTVTLIRDNKESGKIKSLTVNKGRLLEEFKKNRYEYSWLIPKGVNQLTKDDVTVKLFDTSSYAEKPEVVSFTQDGDKYIINVKIKENVDFGYSGGEQVFTVPYTGFYKLETWGAASGTNIGGWTGIVGGYGGYSVGAVELEAGDSLYINVGGQPLNGGYIHNTTAAGGYNGGGSATTHSQYDDAHPGGGATHIATESGLLSSFSNKRDKVLIVSGGGGGGYSYLINNVSYSSSGGSGGGYIGGIAATGTCTGRALYVGAAASQTSAGTSNGCGFSNGVAAAFGQGGSEYTWSAGGGGGWYGGGYGFAHGANGGSGYIGSSQLVSLDGITKHMTGFSVPTSTADNTRTYSTSAHSSSPIADYAKEGHGYARITLLDANTITKTYTLTMQREISDDARLATLTSDKGIFTEEFDKDKDEYVLEMYHKETKVSFDATPFEQDAEVIDGLGEVDLPTDETEHTITVQAENGTIKVYTVIIRRNMYIEDLGLNGLDDLYCKSDECHITPEFRPEVIDYEYRVPLDYNILDAYYEPASADHRSEMTINGEPYVDGYVLPYKGVTVVQVHVYNDNDEIVKTYTMNVIKKYEEIEEFDYTGEQETYIAPRTGKYLIEIWGAAGGTFGPSTGGYGGYSVGSIDLDKKEKIYITVGGQGVQNTTANARSSGGYNGGGSGGAGSAGYPQQAGGSGGGATHVATTNRGTLVNYNANRNDVLIVAGGGGGGSYTAGGSGGGYIGASNPSNSAYVTNTYPVVTGGTQTAGAHFANGGDGRNALDEWYASGGTGGGGGGWYGGNAYQYTGDYSSSGGAGGSGHIANSTLKAYEDIEKHMTCYNCSTSNEVDTKTMSNTCHSATPTTDCSKEGNGYAKISLLETETMLASLSVDDVTIVEPFDKFRTEYTWIIPKGVDEFTSENITATLLHPDKAHIEWPSEPVHFNQDGDKFTFKVVADNGEEDTYILTMVRYKSDDARLKSLESDKGVISPEFDPDTNSYEIDLYEYLDSITLDAETIDPDATIVSGIGEIELEEDIVEHEIIVTAEDGTINVYNVTIKKDAYLLYLGLNGLGEVPCVEDECTLVPPFEPSSNEYSIKVPYEYETLDVYYLTSTPEHSVKIKVGGVEVSNYSLPEGDTLVTVELYNKNNILVNTYTMNVNRAKGNYATLETLEVSVGDLNAPYTKDLEEYTWILPDNISDNLEDYISYTTTDPGATVELIPSSISYTGEGSKFDIKVTAEDGVTTKTYTINLQQDIIEDIEVEENMLLTVGETKNLYVNGLPEGSVGKYLYEVDQNAIIWVYDNGDVYGLFPGTATVTISVKNHPEIDAKTVHVTVISDKITSQVLDVKDKSLARIIIGEEPETNVNDFLDKIDNPKEYLVVYDKDDNLVDEADYDSTIVTTGMKVKLVINGTEHDEVVVIVRGDLNGDGRVNVMDLSKVSDHILEKELITGYKLYAADLVENEEAPEDEFMINVMDQSKFVQYILENIDSLND